MKTLFSLLLLTSLAPLQSYAQSQVTTPVTQAEFNACSIILTGPIGFFAKEKRTASRQKR